MASFLDQAIGRNEAAWKHELEHPFVQGIADGTLPEDRFRFYLQQDYVFLVAYARVLGIATALSDDLATMTRFAGLLHATLTDEMEIHRRTCASYGIDQAELLQTKPALACAAYTGHLLEAAGAGSLPILCAALLPCAVGYSRIGRELASRPERPSVPAYRDWIETYGSAEFQEYADWLSELTDQLARAVDAETRDRMLVAFDQSVQHEIAFWEMAWKGSKE
jgi:thiaminase/transcriptional activator TenA